VDSVLVQGFHSVLGFISWALFAFALFATGDAAFRREDAYRAADKRTKPFWLVVLAISAIVILMMPFLSILPIIGVVATTVYMVDVRPALKQVTGGNKGRYRGSSSDGPYGPFRG
jgi:Protein of unknown function (DUF2516)